MVIVLRIYILVFLRETDVFRAQLGPICVFNIMSSAPEGILIKKY